MISIYSKNNNSEEIEIVQIIENICQKYKVPEFSDKIIIEICFNTRNYLKKTLAETDFVWVYA